MQQQEIHNYLIRFFHANGCEILENHPAYLTVSLTIDMDKALMNRPFYWHYLEKTGGVPNPMNLTLITDAVNAPEDIKGDAVHFGSPRLHQIFQTAKELAGFIRLYEDPGFIQGGQQPLYPWLCLNVKISYQSDLKKDTCLSLGLNMISGEIVEGFHDELLKLPVTPKIPDLCFTLSPLIKPASGMNRLDTYIRRTFEGDDHQWAQEAAARWDEDLALLEKFYEDQDEKGEHYETEKAALQAQYEPKIDISIINGGLFYLKGKAG